MASPFFDVDQIYYLSFPYWELYNPIWETSSDLCGCEVAALDKEKAPDFSGAKSSIGTKAGIEPARPEGIGF